MNEPSTEPPDPRRVRHLTTQYLAAAAAAQADTV
jgi:hypothetical protein